MERPNCLRCAYRHEDNGNCTAAGGFCTAVPAAHCRLLQEYLDTGLTPKDYARAAEIDDILLDNYYPIGRICELIKADREGLVVVLPCKVGGEVYSTLDDFGRLHQCRATYVRLDERPYLNIVALEPVDYESSRYGASFGAFGRTVFLTREEAEEALRRPDHAEN